MIELLNNPVTIIAGLLGLFFLLMGLGRRVIARRERTEQNREKPYSVSSPYAAPVEDETAPAESAAPRTAAAPLTATAPQASAQRFFREYGTPPSAAQTADADSTGYAWE